jgi:acyl transferase domain-containing protein
LEQQTGNLEAAAGIAGVIKVALALKNRILPPYASLEERLPQDYLTGTPFYTNPRKREWDSGGQPGLPPSRGAVNAWGIGGSKGHVVLEAFGAEKENHGSQPDAPIVFVLSAGSEERLKEYARRMSAFLRSPSEDQEGKPTAKLNIRKVLKEIEDDILSLSSDILKTDSDGFTADSVGEFTEAVNRLLGLDFSGEYFLKAPSIGGFIQNLGRDFKEGILSFYRQKQQTEVRSDINMERLAFTLQTGREEMAERLAVVASTTEELAAMLSAFTEGAGESGHLFYGNIKDNAQRFGFLLDGEEGAETVKKLAAKRNYANLARFWVLGGIVDWNLLYSSAPGRMALPTYPFSKKKYWLSMNNEDKQEKDHE